MPRSIIYCTTASCLLSFFSSPAPADEARARYQKEMASAAKANEEGDWVAAAASYRAAWDVADRSQLSARDQAEAALQYAFALRASGDNTDKSKNEMFYAYKAVVRLAQGNPELSAKREMACNNLGVLYYQRGQVDKAVEVFGMVPEPANPDAYIYHYNFARCLEKRVAAESDALARAYAEYWKALELQPGYAKASDAVVRLLKDEPTHRYAEVLRLMVVLTTAKPAQSGLAVERLDAVLQAWGKDEGADALLPAVVRYLVAAGATPTRYDAWKRGDRPVRMEIAPVPPKSTREITREAPAVKQPPSPPPMPRGILQDMDRAFGKANFVKPGGDTTPWLFRSRNEVLASLPTFARLPGSSTALDRYDGEGADMSQLLSHVADWYARQAADKSPEAAAQAQAALARYSSAFMLDPTNQAAAINAAAMLAGHVGGIDPQGTMLDKFVESIYQGKIDLLEAAVQRKGKPNKEDWLKVYYFRIVLVDIFARKKQWGQTNESRSAIGQLKLAIDAEKKIYADGQRPPSWLQYSLADACPTEKDKSEAIAAIQPVVESWIENGRQEFAARSIGAMSGLSTDEKQKRRLAGLDALARVRTRDFPLEGNTPLVVFREGSVLTTIGGRRFVSLDVESGRQGPDPLRPPESSIELPSFSADTTMCAWKDADQVCVSGNAFGPKPLSIGDWPVKRLTLSSDAGLLALAGPRGVSVVDVAKMSKLRTLDVAGERVEALAFAPRGNRLATAGNGRVQVWDARSGEAAANFELHSRTGVSSLAFSPDGDRLIAGCLDGAILSWSIAGRKERQSLHGHRAPVTALAFAPQGPFLASGDQDGRLRLWTADSLAVGPLPFLPGRCYSLSFSPDRKRLVAGVQLRDRRTSEIRSMDLSPLLELR